MPPDLHRNNFATMVICILVRKVRVKHWRSQGTFGISASHSIHSSLNPFLSCGASHRLMCPVAQEKPQRFIPGGCRESEQSLGGDPHFQCKAQRSSGGADLGLDQPRFLPKTFLRAASWPLGRAEGHQANTRPAQC